jgi:hypothetical protein
VHAVAVAEYSQFACCHGLRIAAGVAQGLAFAAAVSCG